MQHDRLPCVIGLGARTPVGRSWQSSAAAVRAGLTRLAEHPRHLDPDGRAVTVARTSWLDPARGGTGRLASLAVASAQEALAGVPAGKLPTWLAIAAPRPGRPARLESSLASRLIERLAESGHALDVADVLATDHSAGVDALARACEQLRAGRCEVALVGGVDSQLEGDTLDWLHAERRLYGERNPWGFVPGEAAGFVALATSQFAARHRLPVLARVVAAAAARETMLGPDDVNTGAGLGVALRTVLQALPTGARIDRRWCDCNGEPNRANEFGFATVRISDRLVDPNEFTAPADCWGDVGAASGPLLLALAVAAAQRGDTAGPYALLTTSSPGGLRGAAILHAEPRPPPAIV